MSYHHSKRMRRVSRGSLGGLLEDIFGTSEQRAAAGEAAMNQTAHEAAHAAAKQQPKEQPKEPSTVDKAASLIGALLANKTKAQQQPVVYQQPSSGMSTGTLVALGALGLGILYVATK